MKKTFYKADKTADKMKNIQQMNRKTAEVEQKSGKKDSSNVEGKSKKPAYRLRVPKLRLAHRLFLYVLMLGFGALAICCTVFSFAPSAAEIVIYILAAILLFTGCFYLYFDLRYGIRRGMQEIIRPRIAANTYTSKVASDARLRTVVFAVPGAVLNVIFAIFNGVMGIWGHSAWFGSLAAYYMLLSMMRIGAVKQEQKLKDIVQPELRYKKELGVYKRTNALFVVMAVVLGGMVVLLVHSVGGKQYPGFMIYVAALYSFYRIIRSTIHLIRDRKGSSPLLMSIHRIGYVDSCVSILTLQTAMFAAFGNGEELLIRSMNGATGAGVSLIVLFLGIQGIVQVIGKKF